MAFPFHVAIFGICVKYVVHFLPIVYLYYFITFIKKETAHPEVDGSRLGFAAKAFWLFWFNIFKDVYHLLPAGCSD